MTTRPNCPTWCTIHQDPWWTGAHYGDPLELGAVLDIGGVAQPATLTAVRTKTSSGEWIEVSTEELRHLHIRIDLSGALRLAEALHAVAGSMAQSHWDQWLQ
ncbi:hypothetical protein M3667_06460 [Microbacterium sp. P26]|uniref:hypothetical protein n=1 Tax=Microbacterium TaxID=33882 RepID=UPI00203F59D3|nr:hypothetical protein [Microbacterium sp. P26]MCM3501523.1 hypothetical protein [Microbacterium sp. P26]